MRRAQWSAEIAMNRSCTLLATLTSLNASSSDQERRLCLFQCGPCTTGCGMLTFHMVLFIRQVTQSKRLETWHFRRAVTACAFGNRD